MFELIQHPNQQPSLLEALDIQWAVIEQESQLSVQLLLKVDGVLVQSVNAHEAELIVHHIRSHKTKEVSLLPIFVDSNCSYAAQCSFLFDGIYESIKQTEIVKRTRSISSRIRSIQYSIHELEFDRFSKLRFLQYIYSRNIILKPKLSRWAQSGYAYPFVYSFIKKKDDTLILKLLNQLADDGYVKSRVQDKTHGCPSCNSGMLSYRECCPKCKSADLRSSDLIHHFVCANIGPEEDYKVGNDLICPKCDKELRHIGIDYDKPSSMYTCNVCDHEFQHAEVKALCIDCGNDNELSQLGEQVIYTYEITDKGAYAAQFGFNERDVRDESQTSSIVSVDIFELFKKQEKHRVKTSHHSSYEIIFHVHSSTLEGLHDDRKEIVQQEIARIISNYLSASDLICSQSVEHYRALLCDSNEEYIKELCSLLHANISKLLADGLDTSANLLDIDIIPITDGAR